MGLKSNNVLIIQRRMTNYRVPLFESMRHRLAEAGVNLHVASGTPISVEVTKRDGGILSWGLKIPCRYWKFNGLQIAFQPIPKALLKQQDLVVITHENAMIFNYWLLLRRRFTRTRIAFWGHGGNFQSVIKNSLSEKLKTWIAAKVDWWFAYTSLSVEKVISTGFPENRITCLNNTIDVDELVSCRKSISSKEIDSLRDSLGLYSNNVGIFIGSLYKEKRLNFLFTTVDKLKQRLPDFELLIIGDGPLRDMVRNSIAARPWTRWVGAKHDREKVLYASLGHVMLNPGLVGLGILDSFTMGLPMVTTDCGIHSPEIAYLESGRNGLMTANDSKAFVDGVLSLYKNPALRDSMVAACKEDSTRYSLEKMVKNFSLGILKALDCDKK